MPRERNARPRSHRPDPGRPRRVVARPARDDHFTRHPPAPDERGREACRWFRALHEARHLPEAEAGRGEHLLRPAPVRDVEPQGARRVRHLGHVLAAQPVAEPVLGEQDLRDAREHLRLVGGDPHELRGGEARHREVAGDAARVRNRGFERRTLRARAPVVPEDRGPQHLAPRVEEGRAVHLAGEPDGPGRGERRAVPGLEPVQGPAGGRPPVLRRLLRPEGPGRRDVERGGRLPDDAVVTVHENRLHP